MLRQQQLYALSIILTLGLTLVATFNLNYQLKPNKMGNIDVYYKVA